MTLRAIFVDRAFTPSEEIPDAVLLVEGPKIVSIGRREQISIPASALRQVAKGLAAVPGFVDVHIHGACGHDVMEGTAAALGAVTAAVAQHGTTALVATTVSASEEATCRAIGGITQWIRAVASTADAPAAGVGPKAEILGVHLEGPFISKARRGAHPEEWVTPASAQLFHKFVAAGGGKTIRMLTLAPELPGAIELIEVARSNDTVVALGHTDATYEEAMRAIEHGARHAAHVFNAMRPFTHRDTGVIGAVLTTPTVTAELIADGVHVDAAAMRILLAAKGPHGVVLVSDAMAATGMPDGDYRLGTSEVNVTAGIARTAAGKLAGSTLTLDRALTNLMALGIPFTDVLPMLTANPARVLGLEKSKGHLAAGADADIVFLDKQWQVAGVMTRGTGWPRD